MRVADESYNLVVVMADGNGTKDRDGLYKEIEARRVNGIFSAVWTPPSWIPVKIFTASVRMIN